MLNELITYSNFVNCPSRGTGEFKAENTHNRDIIPRGPKCLNTITTSTVIVTYKYYIKDPKSFRNPGIIPTTPE